MLLIVLAWWLITRKLPPADRPITLAADAQQPPLAAADVDRAAAVIAGPLAAPETLEKVAMLVMVTGIFGMALDVALPPVSLAIGVGLVVVVTTLISHWMTRRGYTRHSGVRQFLVTTIVIWAVVLGLTLITPMPGGQAAIVQTLFFVVLMSVLVTMYDRYRPRYVARFTAA